MELVIVYGKLKIITLANKRKQSYCFKKKAELLDLTKPDWNNIVQVLLQKKNIVQVQEQGEDRDTEKTRPSEVYLLLRSLLSFAAGQERAATLPS